jgi:hypothetical protein
MNLKSLLKSTIRLIAKIAPKKPRKNDFDNDKHLFV